MFNCRIFWDGKFDHGFDLLEGRKKPRDSRILLYDYQYQWMSGDFRGTYESCRKIKVRL